MLTYETTKDMIAVTTSKDNTHRVLIMFDDLQYVVLDGWHTWEDKAGAVFCDWHYCGRRKRVITQDGTEVRHADIGGEYEKLEPSETWQIHPSWTTA